MADSQSFGNLLHKGLVVIVLCSIYSGTQGSVQHYSSGSSSGSKTSSGSSSMSRSESKSSFSSWSKGSSTAYVEVKEGGSPSTTHVKVRDPSQHCPHCAAKEAARKAAAQARDGQSHRVQTQLRQSEGPPEKVGHSVSRGYVGRKSVAVRLEYTDEQAAQHRQSQIAAGQHSQTDTTDQQAARQRQSEAERQRQQQATEVRKEEMELRRQEMEESKRMDVIRHQYVEEQRRQRALERERQEAERQRIEAERKRFEEKRRQQIESRERLAAERRRQREEELRQRQEQELRQRQEEELRQRQEEELRQRQEEEERRRNQLLAARSQSETSRSQSETSRSQSETLRSQSETSRSQSQTSRSQGQTSRETSGHRSRHDDLRSRCSECNVNGTTYPGHSRFKYTLGCYRYRCICNCDGSHVCPEHHTINICERDRERERPSPPACNTCDAKGKIVNGNSYFDLKDGCTLYKNCICRCNGSWHCPKERAKNVCAQPVENEGCRECKVYASFYPGNSRFKYEEGCFEYNCDCNCDGGWVCPPNRTRNICQSGCGECEIQGEFFEGNSYFKQEKKCIEYTCFCHCNGSWSCPGEQARNICRTNETTGCSRCQVNTQESYPGNSKFNMRQGCIHYECYCKCDGGWDCPGAQARNICRGEQPGGCRSCQVSDNEHYPGDSDFEMRKDCIHYQCRCNCDGSWNCPGEQARDVCKGEVPGGCRSCRLSDTEFYRGNSDFEMRRGCIHYKCSCNCDGSWNCPGKDARNVCLGEVPGGCRSCEAEDGKTYPGNSRFRITQDCKMYECSCMCNGSVDCSPDTARYVCDKKAVNKGTCKSCNLAGKSYEGDSDFQLDRGCYRYQCKCDCSGRWSCDRDNAEDICQSQKEYVTPRTSDTCKNCQIHGKEYAGGSEFRLKRGCISYRCKCACDGRWECPGDQAANFCPGAREPTRACKTCEVDGESHSAGAYFDMKRGCVVYRCKCRCDGSYGCHVTMNRACTGGQLPAKCGNCIIDGFVYPGNMGFYTRNGCIQKECQCNCDGSYTCPEDRKINICTGGQGQNAQDFENQKYFTQDGRRYYIQDGQRYYLQEKRHYINPGARQYLTQGSKRNGTQGVIAQTGRRQIIQQPRQYPGFEYPQGTDQGRVFLQKTVVQIGDSGTGQHPGTGTQYAGTHESGSQNTGTHETRTQYSGTRETGTQYTGIPQAGTQYARTHQTGKQYTETQETGTQYTGIPQTGTQYAGTHKTGTGYMGTHTGQQSGYGGSTQYTHSEWQKEMTETVDGKTVSRSEGSNFFSNTQQGGQTHGAENQCNNCIIEGQIYPGNTQFRRNKKCIEYQCVCHCTGSWSCSGEYSSGCTPKTGDISGKCRTCTVNGVSHAANTTFALIQGCSQYNCKCNCDGRWYCPDQSPLHICKDDPHEYEPTTCMSCDVRGTEYPSRTNFFLKENCYQYTCKCHCDGSWSCSKAGVAYVCEQGKDSLDQGMVYSHTQGGSNVQYKQKSCQSCEVNKKSYIPNHEFQFREGCTQYRCDCFCNGTWECPANRTVNLCPSPDYRIDGCKECVVKNQTYPGGSRFQYREGCWEFNCVCGCNGARECPPKLTRDLCKIKHGVSSRCQPCNIDGKIIKSKSTFNMRQGCNEFLCDCKCDGTWECPKNRSLNVCQEGYRSLPKKGGDFAGCKVGNRTFFTRLFAYTEDCIQYMCLCYDNGAWKCPPESSKKVC